jgi:hypothetical protein
MKTVNAIRRLQRSENRHTTPRRLPRFERLNFAEEFPPNATSDHRADPLWREFLRVEGYEATRERIAAQMAERGDQ